ncbi:hypothetical protein COOONC_04951, partial [Cooperia oncophora]
LRSNNIQYYWTSARNVSQEYVTSQYGTAVVFNPECWPTVAIVVIILRLLFKKNPRPKQQRNINLVELLAVALILMPLLSVQGCQEVDIFSHHMTECSAEKKICKVRVSEVLKINPFKKEACFKLRSNSTVVHEIRVSWDSLILSCEPETVLFTRDTTYNVIDSKRCPRKGSCVGEKCATIKRSSVIPELSEGNKYPGVTSCTESCGGPGCDCFWWGSGCLFYRIYLKPRTRQIFEIFKCARWTEAAKVKFTLNTLNGYLHQMVIIYISIEFNNGSTHSISQRAFHHGRSRYLLVGYTPFTPHCNVLPLKQRELSSAKW